MTLTTSVLMMIMMMIAMWCNVRTVNRLTIRRSRDVTTIFRGRLQSLPTYEPSTHTHAHRHTHTGTCCDVITSSITVLTFTRTTANEQFEKTWAWKDSLWSPVFLPTWWRQYSVGLLQLYKSVTILSIIEATEMPGPSIVFYEFNIFTESDGSSV